MEKLMSFLDWLATQMASVTQQEIDDFESDDELIPGDEPLTQVEDQEVKVLYILMNRMKYELDEINRLLTESNPDHRRLERQRMIFEFQLDMINHLFWGSIRHQLLQEDDSYENQIPLYVRADWVVVWNARKLLEDASFEPEDDPSSDPPCSIPPSSDASLN
jgi:hypothetical protein